MYGYWKAVPVVFLLLTTVSIASLEAQDAERMTLVEFTSDAVESWYVVNDGVMGGRSSSEMRHEEGDIGVFDGNLSLENNGGFASVRAVVAEGALAGASAPVLRVRGDGKRYQLRLRMGGDFDGVAYAAGFETTAGQWTTLQLPLKSFRPTFRGYVPRNAKPLDSAQVRQIGIMLTDKQEGPFRLEIAGLEAVKGRNQG